LAEGRSEETLAEKVSALVARGDLDIGEPAYGVALAAIDLGYDRLTRAQRALYDRVVAPALAALANGAAAPAQREQPARPSSTAPAVTIDTGDPWKPIREAPEDQDLQVATMVDGKPSALAFPCRKANKAWVNSATGKPIFVKPSRWRAWAAG